MPNHGPVADALAGEMLVPQIGCSGCQDKDRTIAELVAHIAKLEKHIADQDVVIDSAEQFIQAYQAEQTNRATRRRTSRARHRLAPTSRVSEPPSVLEPPDREEDV